MFALLNRDTLPTVVLDTLDDLLNHMKGFFGISFNEDGTLIDMNPLLNAVTVGVPIPWLTDTPPAGHLLLDGSQKNRVAYKVLYDLWGTTFGAGDGTTTFNLPDMRGRMFLGKAASGTGSVLGETGGEIDHDHSTPAASPSVAGSTAAQTATATAESPFADVNVDNNNDGIQTSVAGPGHTHPVSSHLHGAGTLAVSISAATTGTANPPYFVGNWIVFAGV